MALSIDQIVRLYRFEGTARYGMEAVSQDQHALQCAALAEEAGAAPELVAAALLHDIGHLLYVEPDRRPKEDALHEYRALPFLRGAFPDPVLEPIRLHVAAKRFLCFADPDYRSALSAASKYSLDLQGGPFGAEAAAKFSAQPHAMEAVALRRWDDQAKNPDRATPGWDHYRRLLERLELRPERAAGGGDRAVAALLR
ncbi:MAG TPA: HD domain-containing protein [Ramlibacter sp.]|nr:HD domain-containing protein [Ramlibacter sp.]